MDPDVTLEAIIDAINDGDVITARERMADVDRWITDGGYVPTNYGYAIERMESFDLEAEELINNV